MQVDGKPRALSLDPRTTVLDALREHLVVTALKKGCGQGQCGACTCLVDGRRATTCEPGGRLRRGGAHRVT